MASKIRMGTKLQLVFSKFSYDKEIKRTKTFSKVKENATEQDIYDFALALAMLQKNVLSEIIVNERSQITE